MISGEVDSFLIGLGSERNGEGDCRDSAVERVKVGYYFYWTWKICSHGRVRESQGATSLQQLLYGLKVWSNRVCHLSTRSRPSYVCEARGYYSFELLTEEFDGTVT